jgi:hypothetical protein
MTITEISTQKQKKEKTVSHDSSNIIETIHYQIGRTIETNCSAILEETLWEYTMAK